MSKHSNGYPTFIQWQPHTPIEFKGEKSTEVNHEQSKSMS